MSKNCNTHISHIYKTYLEFSSSPEAALRRHGKRLKGRIIRTRPKAINSLRGDRSPDDLGSPRATAAFFIFFNKKNSSKTLC